MIKMIKNSKRELLTSYLNMLVSEYGYHYVNNLTGFDYTYFKEYIESDSLIGVLPYWVLKRIDNIFSLYPHGELPEVVVKGTFPWIEEDLHHDSIEVNQLLLSF